MEVHLGEIVGTADSQGILRARKCIIWLNGKTLGRESNGGTG